MHRTPGTDYESLQSAYNQKVGHLEFHQSCNCIGPRNGEPLCRCMMRGVKIVDGRYIQVKDLGPAPSWNDAVKAFPG